MTDRCMSRLVFPHQLACSDMQKQNRGCERDDVKEIIGLGLGLGLGLG